jgi:integrase/recombinase XerD
VTHLRQLMLDELQRRNYSKATARIYIRSVKEFAELFGRSPAKLGPEHVRQYQVHLLKDRKLSPETVAQRAAALRFFYVKTLRRRYLPEHIPYPKIPQKLPTVLSEAEVQQMFECTMNLQHRAMLLTLYSAGLRRSELCQLKLEDIDSQRMMIRIRHGKGGRDREVPLSNKLLDVLREYWRWKRPKTYLFPSDHKKRIGQPVSDKVIWWLCKKAAREAGIRKKVSPHTMRHSYATHMLEAGADLRTIQVLLGHKKLEDTIIYLHLSKRHLTAVANPLDRMEVDAMADVFRARRQLKKR